MRTVNCACVKGEVQAHCAVCLFEDDTQLKVDALALRGYTLKQDSMFPLP
jgi:hypothetical protein